MVTVQLNNLSFLAYHGVHKEEKILGNTYLLDCLVNFPETCEVIESIEETINYTTLFTIIKERMAIPSILLETVVMDIGKQIHSAFPEVTSISISIKKMHPPLQGMSGTTGVTWQKEYN